MLLATLTSLLLCVAPWEGLITVDPVPADAEVFVDDDVCALPYQVGALPPGRHVILVRKEGFEHRVIELTTSLNERRFVHVDLLPTMLAPRVRQSFAKNIRLSGWVVLGVSIATMATAGVLQLSVLPNAQNRASAISPQGDAPLADRASYNQASYVVQQVQTSSIGVAVAGGVLLAGAIALLAAGPDPDAPAASTDVAPVSVTPIVGPTLGGAHAGLMLAF